MDLESIKDKATQFCESYAAAVALCHTDPKATLDDLAEAVASHYAENFIAFSPGGHSVFEGKEHAVASVKTHLARYANSGLGLDIRQPKRHVEVLSQSNALCRITWSVHPPAESKLEGFEYDNVYSFRLPIGQENGFWDFAIADNEMTAMVQSVPTIFDDVS